MLPLLLIPSWALAIDPFFGKLQKQTRIIDNSMAATHGLPEYITCLQSLFICVVRAQEGINSKGNVIDMTYPVEYQ